MNLSDYLYLMRGKYHVKTSAIAAETGISSHYLYKIMNGTRRTAERDYVILICRSMKMNSEETVNALELNGMNAFRPDNPRDQLILECIRDNKNIRMLNQILEEAGYQQLKFHAREL